MNPDELAKQVGLFVVIAGVIIAGAAAAGFSQPAPSPDYGQEMPAQFQPDNIVTTPSAQEGEIEVQSDEKKTVLIDRSHQNQYTRGEIDTLVSTLIEDGHTVQFYGSQNSPGRNLNESLREADAFVVINPTAQFRSEEIAGIESFTDGGGRLLIMGDPSTLQISFFLGATSIDHDPTDLSSRFGVGFGTGYLYNMEENAYNYQNIYAEPSTDSELTEGIDRVILHDAAPVYTTQRGDELLTGLEGTRLSDSREPGNYAMLVRNDNVTAIGDTSFLAPSDAYDADNEVLIGNLAEFLVTGDKADCIPPKPEEGEDRPFGPAPPRPGEQPSQPTTPTPTDSQQQQSC
jgi:hypothetical protein